MKTYLTRFLIILTVGIAAGMAHGIVADGFHMPPKPPIAIPPPPPREDQIDIGIAEGTLPEPIASDPELVTVHEYFSQQAIFIDARTEEEYLEGRIPGAFHGPFEAFVGDVPNYMDHLLADPAQAIIVYCGGGDCHASEDVASKLMEYGLEAVYVFRLGYPAWVDAGFPVEAGGGL